MHPVKRSTSPAQQRLCSVFCFLIPQKDPHRGAGICLCVADVNMVSCTGWPLRHAGRVHGWDPRYSWSSEGMTDIGPKRPGLSGRPDAAGDDVKRPLLGLLTPTCHVHRAHPIVHTPSPLARARGGQADTKNQRGKHLKALRGHSPTQAVALNTPWNTSWKPQQRYRKH